MKIKRFKYFISIALIGLLFFIALTIYNKKDKEDFEVVPFQTEGGWGYEIHSHNKPFIRQEYIPAISGNHPFSDKESAMKIGNKVVEKINKHEIPSITIEELRSMNIKIDFN